MQRAESEVNELLAIERKASAGFSLSGVTGVRSGCDEACLEATSAVGNSAGVSKDSPANPPLPNM